MTELTYWNNKGNFQKLAVELDKLIPSVGGCSDPYLEMFRIVRNVYYDIYNNGCCNAHRFVPLELLLCDSGDGFNVMGTLALEIGILENFTDIEIETLREWVSTVCDGNYDFDNHNDEQDYILGLIERLTDAVVYKVAKVVLVFN